MSTVRDFDAAPLDPGLFDPAAPHVVVDPYPWYRALRERAPALHVERADLWVITRYDDVLRALRDVEAFSSNTAPGGALQTMATLDPPEHTRLRRMLQKAFTPRAIRDLARRIAEIVDERIDATLAHHAGDFIADFAYPIPVTVIAELLGVPLDRRDDLRRWSGSMADVLAIRQGGLDPSHAPDAFGDAVEFVQYMTALLDERRRHRTPADDLIARLVALADDERELTDQQLVGFCVFLLVAGHETTTNLLGNGLHIACTEPGVQDRLRADPDLVPRFVEEVLRYESPIQRTFRRTTRAVEVGGTTIPAGAMVLVFVGAANRDPRRFPDPDVFDLDRDTDGHLAFGSAAHFCLGAPLARLEADIAWRTLLRRTRSIALDSRASAVRRSRPGPRGFVSLPVVVDAADRAGTERSEVQPAQSTRRSRSTRRAD